MGGGLEVSEENESFVTLFLFFQVNDAVQLLTEELSK